MTAPGSAATSTKVETARTNGSLVRRDCVDASRATARSLPFGLVVVPTHDRSFGEEWDDDVDPEFGELLDDEFRSLALDQRERDGEGRERIWVVHDLAEDLQFVAESAPSP
jgi:hypothetical protein